MLPDRQALATASRSSFAEVIGAPFWGLVFALIASALLEREALRATMQG